MNQAAYDVLLALGRTTCYLTLAGAVAAVALRLTRTTSPAVHRVVWGLVVLVGWTFPRADVSVPWYDPPRVEPVASLTFNASDDEALPQGPVTLSIVHQVVPPEAPMS